MCKKKKNTNKEITIKNNNIPDAISSTLPNFLSFSLIFCVILTKKKTNIHKNTKEDD